MNHYDPDRAPKPARWLALDEQERIMLVEEYHRRADAGLPKPRLHATIHAVVETQLAMHLPAAVGALKRLRTEGLDRHDAIHAIGSVLAEHLFHLLRDEGAGSDSGASYENALERLTAASWRAG